MKKSLIKLIVISLMLSIAGLYGSSVLAQEAAVAETMTVTGKLVGVDVINSTITIEQTVAEVVNSITLSVAATTTIEKAALPVVLGDLVVGDNVTVVYVIDENGAMVAQSISVE